MLCERKYNGRYFPRMCHRLYGDIRDINCVVLGERGMFFENIGRRQLNKENENDTGHVREIMLKEWALKATDLMIENSNQDRGDKFNFKMPRNSAKFLRPS